jgi:hypothetical protein
LQEFCALNRERGKRNRTMRSATRAQLPSSADPSQENPDLKSIRGVQITSEGGRKANMITGVFQSPRLDSASSLHLVCVADSRARSVMRDAGSAWRL